MVSGFRRRGSSGARHFIQRFVPGNALEFASALRPHAPERMQQAVGRIGALGVVADPGAHSVPSVNGCEGSPRTSTATPSFTVTSIAQVSGQSCGQAARTMVSMRKVYSSSSIQCFTGVFVPPCRCERQPMFAVARRETPGGPPAHSAVSFCSRSLAESSAAGSSNCPPTRSTNDRPRPASARSPPRPATLPPCRATAPVLREHGDWKATRRGLLLV